MCVAAGIAGGAIVGGLIQGNAAESAAQTQANAAMNAQQISQNEFNTITGQEKPFMQGGYGAMSALEYGLGTGPNTSTAKGGTGLGYGSLTTPFTTDNWKQLSPMYNFDVQQGRQGVLNQDASQQGSLSGSAAKDLINYNQGAANQSFGQAFNQYQTQQGNIFNRLSTIATLGQNAAANTGYQGTALAGQQATAAQNIGTSLAGGTVGAANAYSGALSSAMPWLQSGGGGNPPPFNPASSAWNTENPSNYQDF
jgi:hypothetical protein